MLLTRAFRRLVPALLVLVVLGCGTDPQPLAPAAERSSALHTTSRSRGSATRAPWRQTPAPVRAAGLSASRRWAPEDYRFTPSADGFHAESAAHGLRADLGAEGAEIASRLGGWVFHPAPTRWGCDGALTAVARATPEAEGSRGTYRRGAFEEWYVNGPRGVEQGFTLPAPPACRSAGGRGVVIELAGGLDATVAAGGKEALLHDGLGRSVLRYGDLHVTDAAGRDLPAELVAKAGGLAIRFEDGEARYPVTVDPMIWLLEDEIAASPPSAYDLFGRSVAIDGDTAVVGAGNPEAFVFSRAGTSWPLDATLTDNGQIPYSFGDSVAVSGDTVVVGALAQYGFYSQVYVFSRSGTVWAPQQALTVNNTGSYRGGVAIDGDTMVVGMADQGAAYVLYRSGGSWALQQALTSGLTDGAYFGASVALSGDTLVVGAPYPQFNGAILGEAFVFVRTGSSWALQQELTPNYPYGPDSDFGASVALSGDTAVVGGPFGYGPAAVYVFSRTGSSWSLQQNLTVSGGTYPDHYGFSVAVGGNVAVVGAPGDASDPGAAYVFVSDGTSWSQQQELTATTPAAGDSFGSTVAVSGLTAIVGSSCVPGLWPPCSASTPGAAYVFTSGDCSAVADGTRCDDGDACTRTDTCQGGVCVGADPVICTATPCHPAGTCEPTTGACSQPVAPDGAPCDDGDACTQTDACQGGVCVGESPVICKATSCHLPGVCNPTTGECSQTVAPDGTPCDDGNACSQTDVCHGGACVGENPLICPPAAPCHPAGVCDPKTGTCSHPVAPDGTSCEDRKSVV
jgi:hypothetical protein